MESTTAKYNELVKLAPNSSMRINKLESLIRRTNKRILLWSAAAVSISGLQMVLSSDIFRHQAEKMSSSEKEYLVISIMAGIYGAACLVAKNFNERANRKKELHDLLRGNPK